jgi:hypothetical protein
MYNEYRPSVIHRTFKTGAQFIVGILSIVIGGIANAIMFGLVLALPIQWLWNNCFIDLFPSVPAVGFWQAYVILVMLKIMKWVIS